MEKRNTMIIVAIVAVLCLLVCIAVSFAAMADNSQDVVFLSDDGDDNNDGASAESPVCTLECAYNKIAGNGTIVLCGAYSVSSSGVAELPVADGHVTLTGVYDGIDYCSDVGARLVLSTDVYIGSDMTVENLYIEQSAAIKMFCQGHNVKIGYGVSTSSNATPPSIFGGTDLTKSTVNIKNSQFFDFTLEICSGTWQYVSCGNFRSGENTIIGVIGDASLIINGGNFKATGTGDSDKEVVSGISGSGLFGDLYMEINGGTFSCSVFGASFCGMNGSRRIPGHYGDMRIVINGGVFNGTQISAVQDKLNFLDGDFSLEINKATFSSSLAQISAEGVDGTSYISCPSSLEKYLVDFGSNVYVRSTGRDTNSGTKNYPVKTLGAAAKLLPEGGRIIICDTVSVGTATLPKTNGDIIITGAFPQADYSGSAVLSLNGSLKLGADTRIENLAIRNSGTATIDANGHDLTLGCEIAEYDQSAKATVGGDISVVGEVSVIGGDGTEAHTVTVNSGTYKTVNGGSSSVGTAVVINGGTVTAGIFGAGSKSVCATSAVEINGGYITADIYACEKGASGDVGVCINGGVIESDVIGASLAGDVTGEFSLGVFGGNINSDVFVACDNAQNTVASSSDEYSKIISGVGIHEKTVFCADGGTGDGKSPLSPVGSLEEASALIGTDGGRIVVSGRLTIMNKNTLSSCQKVKITSFGGGSDFSLTRGARLEMSASLFLSSETLFDHIEFFAAENNTFISAECNRVEFGEDVICSLHEGRGVEYPLSVYGGTYAQNTGNSGYTSTDVTIRSGSYYRVFGGNYRTNGNLTTLRTVTGSIRLSIYGGTFSNAVALVGMNNLTGDAQMDIYGGTFRCPVFAMANNSPDINAAPGRINADVTVNIWGGTFCGNLDASKDMNCNFNGVYTLNVYGGDLSRVTTIRGCDGMADGTHSSVINCDRAMNIDASLSGDIEFTNPIAGYADPSVRFDPDTGYYYYTYAGTYGGKQAIYVTRAPNLCDVGCSDPILIWTAAMQEDGRGSEINSIWAPQINNIDGKWYIYATCSAGSTDTSNRLPYVWVGGESPTDPYSYHGPIDNYDPLVDIYLSPRLIEYGGQRYICNGGFYRASDRNGHQQTLFITKLKTPTAFEGDPVVIARPSRAYEDYKILEGPIGLLSPGGTFYLTYAAGHTRGQEYCTGILKFLGDENDSLANASLWQKMEEPIHFVDYDSRVYSPGAMMFTTSPDGEQLWAVYHAKKYAYTAYTMRRLYAQPVTWVNDYPEIEDPKPVDTVFTFPINSRSISSRIFGFDKKKTVSTVYVSQGASGDGTSPTSPLGSLGNAYSLLGDHGGVIVICGQFNIQGNFTEPVHSGTVIVTQHFGDVDYSGGGTFATGGVIYSYSLSGPTLFRDITFSTENGAGLFIVARYNSVEIGTGVKCIGFTGDSAAGSFTVLGGHNRSEGANGSGKGAACIKIKSGDGIFITGANRYVGEDVTRDVNLEIFGGNIGKIYGGSINGGSCKNITAKLFGGNFINIMDLGYGVSGHVKLTVSGGDFNACPSITGKGNFAEATVYPEFEDTLPAIMYEFDQISIYTSAIYLKQGATGDGSTPENPIGRLTSAYYALGDRGGSIVVMGDFVMESDYSAPAHNGKVIITSVYDGVDYSEGGAFSTGSVGKRYDINGPTCFENIKLATVSGQYLFFVCNYNPFEIGEGVECSGFTGTKVVNSLTIVGGENATKAPLVSRDTDAHITVRSGSGILIAGMNRYLSSDHTSNSVVDIYGGEIVTLYGGNINGGVGGNITLNIYGGSFVGGLYCSDGVGGKVELNIYDGDFDGCTAIKGSKSLSCFAYMRSETKKELTGVISNFHIILEGDVDCDTRMTNRDITMLVRYLSGYSVQVREILADYNADGRVNNRDVIGMITVLAN